MNDSIVIRSGPLAQTTTPNLDYILLDGSGSMEKKWWDMLDAIDSFAARLKAEHVNTKLRLQVFDSNVIDQISRDCSIDDWKTFAQEPIGAHWGGTPLYDAINSMCRTLRDLAPSRCSILIVTDGGENGSRTDRTQAKALLDWCRAQGWQVTFMGCDFNSSDDARALGASETNVIGVQKLLLSEATERFAEKRADYQRFGSPINFTEEERQQFGGYLSAPEEDANGQT